MKKTTYPSLFILDVDGVMTTGQFLYSVSGKEYKIFGAHDNDGVKLLSSKIKLLFLTADERGFPISKKRIVSDMKQKLLLVSDEDRLQFIEKNYGVKNIIYMGDGIHDAPILRECFYGIAPKNARREARRAADFITESRAGEGAVLDACVHIMKKFF
jgi:3-deoxy-D-manno-octulosonate 8-phosphate phosphatase (KDO 8-P phosphatase)